MNSNRGLQTVTYYMKIDHNTVQSTVLNVFV